MSELNVPLPASATFNLSQRAVQIARELAPKQTGAGASTLTPVNKEGAFGISVGRASYMLYLNRGFDPYVRESLEGKIIPFRGPGGGITYRAVAKGAPGTPKIVSRDERGILTASKLQWTHPGIEGSHFIDRALRQALDEWVSTADGKSMVRTLKDTEYRKLIEALERGI